MSHLPMVQMGVLRPRGKSSSLSGVEGGTETRSHAFSPGIFHVFVREIIQIGHLSANKKTNFTSTSLAIITSIPLALYSFILYYSSGR